MWRCAWSPSRAGGRGQADHPYHLCHFTSSSPEKILLGIPKCTIAFPVAVRYLRAVSIVSATTTGARSEPLTRSGSGKVGGSPGELPGHVVPGLLRGEVWVGTTSSGRTAAGRGRS